MGLGQGRQEEKKPGRLEDWKARKEKNEVRPRRTPMEKVIWVGPRKGVK